MDTSRGGATTRNPGHHHAAASLSGTSLQIPRPNPNQSARSSPRTFDQSGGSITRQSHISSTTVGSNWTSASGHSGHSSVNPAYYPRSGYPSNTNPVSGLGGYPTSGYPMSYLQHSYNGYPTNTFPLSQIPGVADLTTQYPSSEFPGGGFYPGEVGADDGSQPYIGADIYPEGEAGGYLGYGTMSGLGMPGGGGGGYPVNGGPSSFNGGPSGLAYMPASLDPLSTQTASGYPR